MAWQQFGIPAWDDRVRDRIDSDLWDAIRAYTDQMNQQKR